MSDPHYDAIIVGSGFGGSVTAYRLAEAGWRVCVLERGKAHPPGSFPSGPRGLALNFWDPSEGLYGMFNVWTFRHIESVVSSGLGGGSLIYGNVLLRKDEHWFVREERRQSGYEYWPVTRAELDPHYDAVEKILGAQSYPFAHAPYDATPKTRAMQDAARALGHPFILPNLAVTFANPGESPAPSRPIHEDVPNRYGFARMTCRLCGECDIGCNFGSKNTLDYNYLTRAERLGAELRTLCEVRSFAPRPEGGYEVRFVQHEPPDTDDPVPQDTSLLQQHSVTADKLVLAAGTLGTNYLLLRNREHFPGLSATLGTRFNGNGDIYGWIQRAHHEDGRPRQLDPSRGPVITSAIRVPDALDGGAGRGHYVEDGGYPEHLNWLIEMAFQEGTLQRVLSIAGRRLRERLGGEYRSDLGADISGMMGRAERTSTSLPMLGMGREIAGGRFHLNRQAHLDTDWNLRSTEAFFDGVRDTMRGIAGALGGQFRVNPTYFLHRVVTVHPLGGCSMGRDDGEGVVDAHGEAFHYPGLYVVDGSVMPGPIGANPSLTIAALADRFAERMVEGRRSG